MAALVARCATGAMHQIVRRTVGGEFAGESLECRRGLGLECRHAREHCDDAVIVVAAVDTLASADCIEATPARCEELGARVAVE